MAARPQLDISSVSEFFWLARERYQMKLRRDAGEPRPWTENPVLRAYRFCNVFREDDRTTVWFREKVRSQIVDPYKLFQATVGFRWFNRIETGEKILDVLLSSGWNNQAVRARLKDVQPLVTGAFMVKTPPAMNKLEGILWCMNYVGGDTYHHVATARTLREAHAALMQVPYLGPFMAYEVVTDLRHTCLLATAHDIMEWCSLGPGATRGLQWLTGQEFSRASQQELMLGVCQELLEQAGGASNWPKNWPKWEMREVEHWLCEYDKWKRGKAGQRLKRRYE